MSGGVAGRLSAKRGGPARPALEENAWARRTLIGLALLAMAVLLLVPLSVVFVSALANGIEVYLRALVEPETLNAVRLTLLAAAVAVPLNLVFGLAAAWVISKYEFWGKSALITLIDLPFSVSPVIAGLIFVLLFGARGWFAPLLSSLDVRVIFAVPGIIIATTFISFPLVAREVLAVMQAQGSDEEEAALTLGASGWQIFRRITLPKVKWGVIYGVILCNARSMGEFGAVSVVSGHIRGETNTMPLHVEILYGEYQFAAAFAVASMLALLAVFTLVLKQWVEWHGRPREGKSAGAELKSKPPGAMLPGPERVST
jgi:sulfate/thiosulfate transport system permease protein